MQGDSSGILIRNRLSYASFQRTGSRIVPRVTSNVTPFYAVLLGSAQSGHGPFNSSSIFTKRSLGFWNNFSESCSFRIPGVIRSIARRQWRLSQSRLFDLDFLNRINSGTVRFKTIMLWCLMIFWLLQQFLKQFPLCAFASQHKSHHFAVRAKDTRCHRCVECSE